MPRKCPCVPSPSAAISRARRSMRSSGSRSSTGSANITQSSRSGRYCALTMTSSAMTSMLFGPAPSVFTPVFSTNSATNFSNEFPALFSLYSMSVSPATKGLYQISRRKCEISQTTTTATGSTLVHATRGERLHILYHHSIDSWAIHFRKMRKMRDTPY